MHIELKGGAGRVVSWGASDVGSEHPPYLPMIDVRYRIPSAQMYVHFPPINRLAIPGVRGVIEERDDAIVESLEVETSIFKRPGSLCAQGKAGLLPIAPRVSAFSGRKIAWSVRRQPRWLSWVV